MGRGTAGQAGCAASSAHAGTPILEPSISPAPAPAALWMNPRRVRPRQASLAHEGNFSSFMMSSCIPAGQPPASLPCSGEKTLADGNQTAKMPDKQTGQGKD